MKDLKSSIAVRASVASAIRTTTLAAGTAVDRKGFDSLTWAVRVASWVDGAHAVSFEHSTDNAEWDAVAADDLIGEAPTVEGDGESPEAGTHVGTVVTVGYRGDRRYVRPVIMVTGSPGTGASIGIDAILGHPHLWPAT